MTTGPGTTAVAVPADPSAELVRLWLHGRSPRTQRVYHQAVARFRAACPQPLDTLTLGDLQAFADKLAAGGLAPATRALQLSAVKSLLAFGHRLGLLPANVGAALRLPATTGQLAARILPERTVQDLLTRARVRSERLEAERPQAHGLAAEGRRNAVLLRLLYVAGLRVAELAGLRWRDCQERGHDAQGQPQGQVTVTGKGNKARAVLLPADLWAELAGLRGDASADAPVFRSRRGGPLSTVQVFRIVQDAARAAGLAGNVSPHWFRHAHASHALDNGAPIHLVQQTLGHASVAVTSRYTHARPGDSSSRYLRA